MSEDSFVVQGNSVLKGEISLSGAKNVALKIIIASLLFDEPVRLSNIPNLKDIRELISLCEQVGVVIEYSDGAMTIDPRNMSSHEVDLLHGSKTRVSFMLFAPFLKRFGKARIPNPGGCRIGARPINRHIELLKAFGVDIEYDSNTGYYNAVLPSKTMQAASYRFNKKTHTGTEFGLLLGAFAQGVSVLHNVAVEPEIDDLISFLQQAGVEITKKEHAIEIKGTDKLSSPTKPYHIMYDRNEAVTYAVCALATKGDIFVRNADPRHIRVFLEYLEKIGGGYDTDAHGIRFFYSGELRPSDITTTPEPGFMTDWQAPWAVLMTQAHGVSTIHETVFENRFGYVEELRKLGAKIEFYTPHVDNPEQIYQFEISQPENQAIRIHGHTPLHGGVMNVTDMRAGATLLIAAFAANGESIINGASEIDRGYEEVEYKLVRLGAHIKRL